MVKVMEGVYALCIHDGTRPVSAQEYGTQKSFRSLLEDPDIKKITFDCRGDSDALFHQCGVVLAGVLELQVLDQAVRIQQGEMPPHRCPYVNQGGIPFLQGMSSLLQRYSIPSVEKPTGPHKSNPNAWAERPLGAAAIA